MRTTQARTEQRYFAATWDHDPTYPDADVFVRVAEATKAHLAESNTFDHCFGRQLPGLLEEAGLVDVDNEITMRVTRGGEVLPLAFERQREGVLARGAVTEAEWDTRMRLSNDPDVRSIGLSIVAAWGRKP